MQKHEEWLCERLPEWEAEGLIDGASAEHLRERYGNAGKSVASSGNLAMFIISAIGALLVGLGVIALFAANWGAMSRGMRAGVSMLPLTLCTALAMAGFARGWKARSFWEALGICWTLAIWSGFGLVCQTYHLSDNVSAFVLACTLLCLPVLYLTQSAVATIVWPVLGLVWYLMDWDASVFPRTMFFLVMLAAHLPIFIMIHGRIKFRGLYEFFGVNSIAVAVLFILIKVVEKNAFVFLVILWMGVALWILSEWTKWRPLRFIGFLYALHAILIVPLQGIGFFHIPYRNISAPAIVLFGFLMVLLWAGGVCLLMRKGKNCPPREKSLQIIVILAGMLVASIVVLTGLPRILLYLFVVLASVMALVNALRKLRLFEMNLSLCVLIYEILAKYLASDWSFTAKGLIMLVCGIALLISNVFIIRGRRQAAKEVA